MAIYDGFNPNTSMQLGTTPNSNAVKYAVTTPGSLQTHSNIAQYATGLGGGTNAQGPTPAPANNTIAQPAQQQKPVQQNTGIPQPAQPSSFQSPQPRPQPQYIPVPMPMQQSMTQQAGRGNAQQISNYMQALKQVGAGGNNAAMNVPGQLGAGAVGGFTGFQNNGIQTQLGGQFVGPQNMQNGLNYTQNMAGMNNNYYAGNAATSPGLTQGMAPQLADTGGYNIDYGPQMSMGAGRPNWQTPKPWGNQANMPQNSQQWEDYFYNKYDPDVNPNQQAQPGAFYSPHFAGSGGYNDVISDENAKTNIQYAEPELEDFINQLGVYSYEYKNPEHGAHRYISPMAQEMERSKLGKHMVVTDPKSGYKMVDYGQMEHGRLKGVELAALAMINKKVNQLRDQVNSQIKTKIKSKRK